MKLTIKIFFMFFFPFWVFAQETFKVLEIPEDLKKGANAIINLDETNVIIEAKREMLISRHRIITVLNEKGNHLVGAVVGYDNYNKIKELEAVVYDSYGNKVKRFKKKDFVDHSAVDGGTLYSDSRIMFMPYIPTSYPYTIEFRNTIFTQNTAGIPSWRPIEDYSVSIQKSKYNVIDKSNLGLNKKEYNFKGFFIDSENSESSLSYEINGLKALSYEIGSPSIDEIFPKLSVTVNDFHFYGVDGKASNWVEFGDWVYYKLLKGRGQVSLKTKNDIINLVKDIEDPLKRAKLVYQYVQENTRYISVQVGIGGVQPIPALEVDKVKYGDCKGLTNYTMSLMKIANIPAYYSIVEAGRDKIDFDDNFYSLEQGNHIILAIENKEDLVWVDCTSQEHPFGFVGDFTDDRKVLIVKEGGSKVVKTVAYKNNENLQHIKADIVLNSKGGFRSKLDIQSEGIQYDQRFYISNLPKEKLDAYYKRKWSNINFFELKKCSFSNDKNDVVFNEKLEVESSKYALNVDDKYIFTINVFNNVIEAPKRYLNRELPFNISRGFIDIDDLIIEIPENYIVDHLPENKSLVSVFGEYKTKIKVENNKIVYKRMFLIKEGRYSKEDYNLYRSFLKKIVKADKSKVILKKK